MRYETFRRMRPGDRFPDAGSLEAALECCAAAADWDARAAEQWWREREPD